MMQPRQHELRGLNNPPTAMQQLRCISRPDLLGNAMFHSCSCLLGRESHFLETGMGRSRNASDTGLSQRLSVRIAEFWKRQCLRWDESNQIKCVTGRGLQASSTCVATRWERRGSGLLNSPCIRCRPLRTTQAASATYTQMQAGERWGLQVQSLESLAP